MSSVASPSPGNSPTKRKPVNYINTIEPVLRPSPSSSSLTTTQLTGTGSIPTQVQVRKPPLRNDSSMIIHVGSNVSIQSSLQDISSSPVDLSAVISSAPRPIQVNRRSNSLRRRGTITAHNGGISATISNASDDTDVKKSTLAAIGMETSKKVVPEHYTRKTEGGKRLKDLRRPASKSVMKNSISQEDTLSLASSRASQDTQSYITNEMEKLRKQNQALREQLEEAMKSGNGNPKLKSSELYLSKWNEIKRITDEIMDHLQLHPSDKTASSSVTVDSSTSAQKPRTTETDTKDDTKQIESNPGETSKPKNTNILDSASNSDSPQATNTSTAMEAAAPKEESTSTAIDEAVETFIPPPETPIKKSLSNEILGILGQFGF